MKIILLLLVLAALAGTSFFLAYSLGWLSFLPLLQSLEPGEEQETSGETPRSFILTLSPEGENAESGTVLVGPAGDRTLLIATFEGAPEGVSQPLYMRGGTCAEPGEVLFKLEDALDGRSDTLLSVSMQELRGIGREGGLIIQVFESYEEPQAVVACATI
ncbi:MAG: hypothetical protein Q8P12_05335 [bacterium]|nr:hypothetical protein [bacterium]